MGRVCAVKNCHKKYRVSLFSLPKDNTAKIWLKHLELFINADLRRISICEDHFYEKDLRIYGTYKAVRKGVFPRSNSGICKCTENNVDKSCLAMLSTSLEPKAFEENSDENSESDVEIELFTNSCDSMPSTSKDPIPSVSNDDADGDEYIYSSRNRNYKRKNDKLLNSNTPKKIKEEPVSEDIKFMKILDDRLENEDLSDFVKIFIKMQFHKKNYRWRDIEKQIANNIFHKSPPVYKHLLDMGFNLPADKTIYKWQKKKNWKPEKFIKKIKSENEND